MSSLMRTPSKQRLLELWKVSAGIFGETFNPNNERNGGKYLRKKLKGPVVAQYYGPLDFPRFSYVRKQLPHLNLVSEAQKYKDDLNRARRLRGKGAPAKKTKKSSDKKK